MNPSQRLVILQFALFAALGLAAVLTLPIATPLATAVGIVLALVGVGVIFAAIATHQQINRATPYITPDPNRKAGLITSGIYARLRHPIYAGVLLAAFGVALAHGGAIVWVVMAALYIFFYAKSRYEEALLLHVYPKYADYMKRTGRFLPRL
jgi:protein-S-isoprenylcysteine O-methyltransferase Ste14